MKVLSCDPVRVPGHESTVLRLDGEWPHSNWKSLRIGGRLYKFLWVTGAGTDIAGVPGIHDFSGMEVEFV